MKNRPNREALYELVDNAMMYPHVYGGPGYTGSNHAFGPINATWVLRGAAQYRRDRVAIENMNLRETRI